MDPIAKLPYLMLRDTNTNEIWKIMRLLNVKYMFLHKDTNNELFNIFTDKYKGILYLENRLKNQRGINFEKRFGLIEFYKLSDKCYLPHIYGNLPYRCYT